MYSASAGLINLMQFFVSLAMSSELMGPDALPNEIKCPRLASEAKEVSKVALPTPS